MIEGITFTVGELMEQKQPVAPSSIEAYNEALRAQKSQGNCKGEL